MPEPGSKLDPVIEVDVEAAVKAKQTAEKPITAKVQNKDAKTTSPPKAKKPKVKKPKAKPKKKVAKKPKAKTKPKPKAKAKPKPAQKKDGSYFRIGDFAIHVRKDSAYAHLYRILAQEIKFDVACGLLEQVNLKDEKSCAALIRSIFVDREDFEKKLRGDQGFIDYCAAKTAKIKQQAAKGMPAAKKLLKNEKRMQNGVWVGNVREMLSVCCGSTSPEASNRNMRKYSSAKLSFRQFPRITKGSRAFVTMFPAKYSAKVQKAIKMVFGDEKKKGFADYLDTKIKQVFG